MYYDGDLILNLIEALCSMTPPTPRLHVELVYEALKKLSNEDQDILSKAYNYWGFKGSQEALSRSLANLAQQALIAHAERGPINQNVQIFNRPATPEEVRNLNQTVRRFTLSNKARNTRTHNCFKRSGVQLIGDILSQGSKGLLRTKNFGKKCLADVESEILKPMGFQIDMPIDGWTPDPE